MSPDYHVLVANEAFAALLGASSPDAMVGRSLLEWLTPEAGRRAALSRRLAFERLGAGIAAGRVRTAQDRDGSVRRLLMRATAAADAQGQLAWIRFTSIVAGEGAPHPPGSLGELIQLTAELHEREVEVALGRERRRAFVELGLLATSQPDPRATMARAASVVAELLDVPLVKVVERDDAPNALRIRASHGFAEGAVGSAVSSGDDCQAGFTWRTQAPVVVPDLDHETTFRPSPLLAEHGVHAAMTVPIIGRGTAWGVLGAYDRRRRAFDGDDVQFMQVVANLLGEHIARAAAERDSVALAQALDRAPLLVGRWDADGRVHYLNAAARSAFGYGADEPLTDTLVSELLTPESGAGDLRSPDFAVGPEATPRSDCRCRRRDGSTFVATVRVQVERDVADDASAYLFFGLDITERMASRVRLQASLTEVRTLAARLDAAREEQARRLALDLHDDLGQTLSAARLAVHAITRGTPAQVPERAEMALAVLEESLESLRRVTREMRPMLLELGEVEAGFRALCRNHAGRTSVPVRFEAVGNVDTLPLADAVGLYRVAQEALSNATRHGRAGAIDVAIHVNVDTTVLTVIDDGCGFDATTPRVGGLGLVGMRERMLARGGTLEVTSRRGAGTRVVARLDRKVKGGAGR